VVAGKSVGRTSLGMNKDDVIKLLGKPNKESLDLAIYHTSDKRYFLALRFSGGKLSEIAYTSPNFSTADGITTSNFTGHQKELPASGQSGNYTIYALQSGGLSFAKPSSSGSNNGARIENPAVNSSFGIVHMGPPSDPLRWAWDINSALAAQITDRNAGSTAPAGTATQKANMSNGNNSSQISRTDSSQSIGAHSIQNSDQNTAQSSNQRSGTGFNQSTKQENTSHHSSTNANLVTPGASLARIRLGQTRQEIEKLLGAPAQFNNGISTYWAGDRKFFLSIRYLNERASDMVFSSPSFSTQSGINVNSFREPQFQNEFRQIKSTGTKAITLYEVKEGGLAFFQPLIAPLSLGWLHAKDDTNYNLEWMAQIKEEVLQTGQILPPRLRGNNAPPALLGPSAPMNRPRMRRRLNSMLPGTYSQPGNANYY
jgi:hypothetical protein